MNKSIILLLLFLFTSSLRCQEFDILGFTPESIGIIISNDGKSPKYIGTGFIFIEPNYVFTASHVIQGRQRIVFLQSSSSDEFLLEPIYIDSIQDFAILKCDFPISQKPYLFEFPPDPNLGDSIYYFGYDRELYKNNQPPMLKGLTKINDFGSVVSKINL